MQYNNGWIDTENEALESLRFVLGTNKVLVK